MNSFESLANEMNSHENWIEKQTLLSLDSDTAVFGFSKTGNFECYGCGNLDRGKLRSFYYHRMKSARTAHVYAYAHPLLCLLTRLFRVIGNKMQKDVMQENKLRNIQRI